MKHPELKIVTKDGKSRLDYSDFSFIQTKDSNSIVDTMTPKDNKYPERIIMDIAGYTQLTPERQKLYRNITNYMKNIAAYPESLRPLVLLDHQSKNPYDPNAISVIDYLSKKELGWIPKIYNKTLLDFYGPKIEKVEAFVFGWNLMRDSQKRNTWIQLLISLPNISKFKNKTRLRFICTE